MRSESCGGTSYDTVLPIVDVMMCSQVCSSDRTLFFGVSPAGARSPSNSNAIMQTRDDSTLIEDAGRRRFEGHAVFIPSDQEASSFSKERGKHQKIASWWKSCRISWLPNTTTMTMRPESTVQLLRKNVLTAHGSQRSSAVTLCNDETLRSS